MRTTALFHSLFNKIEQARCRDFASCTAWKEGDLFVLGFVHPNKVSLFLSLSLSRPCVSGVRDIYIRDIYAFFGVWNGTLAFAAQRARPRFRERISRRLLDTVPKSIRRSVLGLPRLASTPEDTYLHIYISQRVHIFRKVRALREGALKSVARPAPF